MRGSHSLNPNLRRLLILYVTSAVLYESNHNAAIDPASWDEYREPMSTGRITKARLGRRYPHPGLVETLMQRTFYVHQHLLAWAASPEGASFDLSQLPTPSPCPQQGHVRRRQFRSVSSPFPSSLPLHCVRAYGLDSLPYSVVRQLYGVSVTEQPDEGRVTSTRLSNIEPG